MTLVHEQIRSTFEKLFQQARVEPSLYRVYLVPATIPDRFVVSLVWDGFDIMSVTARQKWIWDRLRPLMSARDRQAISKVLARSTKEFVIAEEFAQSPS